MGGSIHIMALGTIQREGVCGEDGGRSACVSGWVSWFFTVCGEMSVCQYVTVCDCMSVREWEVCGVKMALMELDVVHNRQDITSERGLKERTRLRVKKTESSNNMAEHAMI